MQRPDWAADEFSAHCLLAAGTQVELSEFGFSDAQTLTLSGTASAGSAVALALTKALEYDIQKGQILDFGSDKYLTLTQRGERGDTTITGDLAANTADADSYVHPGISGRTVVRSGQLVGRTYAERAAGAGFGVADVANDDEIYLVAFQNEYAEQDAGITLVRHDFLVYENRLPGWAEMSAAEQAKVRELYNCITYPA